MKREQQKQHEDPQTPSSAIDPSLDADLNDSASEAAAVKIQSRQRGKMARREVAMKREQQKQHEDPQASSSAIDPSLDADLNDSASEAAAVKIQSRQRGRMARREV